MKIKDISVKFSNALRSHMQSYIGTVIPGIMDGEYSGDGNVYQLNADKAKFLNIEGSLTAYIFKEGDDVIFCIIPKIADKPFADYFPQMVPQTPWLTPVDGKLAFPNLPTVKVTDIKWYYIYASTDKVSDSLWKIMYEGIGADKNLIPVLQSVSRDDVPLDEKDGWRGGFFYTGTLPKLPDSDMIPEFASTAWKFITDNVVIQGCVYRSPIIANLRMQIPILNPPVTFDGGVIKSIELALVFNSPLMAVPQTQPPKNDGEKQTIKQKREIGLVGNILFNNSGTAGITGVWALDDDAFLIKANCGLADLNSYLDGSGIAQEIELTSIKAGVGFKISKAKKQLESIDFYAEGKNLNVIPDIFELKDLKLNCRIGHPGQMNMVTASFSAIAKLGKGNVQLLCNGSYPKGAYNLYLDPAPERQLLLTDIVNIFDSNTGFKSAKAITRLWGQYDSGNKYFAFEMAVADGTTLSMDSDSAAPIGFTMNSLTVGVYGKKTNTFKLNADFSYTTKSGNELKFTGNAAYDAGWRFSAGYKGEKPVTLKDIIDSFNLGSSPAELNGVEFSQLDFEYDKHTNKDTATTTTIKGFAGDISVTIYDRKVNMLLQVQKVNDATYFSGSFSTEISAKPVRFNVEFVKAKEKDTFSLGLQLIFNVAGADIYLQATRERAGEEALTNNLFKGGASGLSVSLGDLLKSFVGTAFNAELPDGFLPHLLILTDIFVSYDSATKQTDIIGLATVFGKEIRVFVHCLTESVYAFGVDTDVDCLDQLPLVGEELKGVSFSNVGFVYASAAQGYKLPVLTVPQQAGAMPVIEFPEEETDYSRGVTLGGAINLPTQDDPIVLALPVSKQTQQYLLLGADNIYALTEGPKSFDPAVKWVNVNKKMGPVALNKLGFKFEGGRLSLLISGAVSLANLSVNVEGMGLSFLPAELIRGDNIQAKFNLDGLGLALKKEPLEISGMLLRAPNQEGESLSFYGGAQISTSGFSIKGIAAYATLKDKSTSLFIYGLYNGPIGGPSFFFVTGIAAGFGYNRTVRVPKLEEVKDFPLVAMALSPAGEQKSLMDVLDDLVVNQWVPSSPGDYWLALGIKFTSFNIIESFVLVTAKFGNKLEFAIVGLSLLKWPGKGTPIVYIELALLAKFGPDSDVIAVTGMLTENSYILNKNCKLTGGFAFYTWISGEHEGDFVITLGGYAPDYKKPAHYPTVDRLALNWKFSDELSLRGEMYYALTPREIMAGGKWEIAYNLSFLSARVIVWADMIIRWAPFQYAMVAGIIVRIEANIKVLFVHIHFKLQLACVVQVWGPPFAGQIYVDWTIFSFTIGFGSGEKTEAPPLVWDTTRRKNNGAEVAGFQESFVPKKDGLPCILDLRVVRGIVNKTDIPDADKPAALKTNTNDAEPDTTYVNGYDIVVAIDSFFPLNGINTADAKKAKKLLMAGEKPALKALDGTTLMEVAGADVPLTIEQRNKGIGVKPMKVDGLDAKLDVWLTRGNTLITENITVIGSAKGVNSALWGIDGVENPDVMKTALTGVKLHAVEEYDPSIRGLELDGRYEEKDPEKSLDALTREEPEPVTSDIAAEIKKILRGNRAYNEVGLLKKIGFELKPPEEIIFDATLYNTPDYMASIGQMLPANIM